MDSTDKILKSVSSITKNLSNGESKIIICPVCYGGMLVSKSSCNGHVHVVCEKCGVLLIS